MKMNCCILCGAEGGVEWAKDDGEEGRDEVSEKECLKDMGRKLWVAGSVFSVEDETVGRVDG